jgi:hypothetical protein
MFNILREKKINLFPELYILMLKSHADIGYKFQIHFSLIENIHLWS